jgi:hypothetical protein
MDIPLLTRLASPLVAHRKPDAGFDAHHTMKVQSFVAYTNHGQCVSKEVLVRDNKQQDSAFWLLYFYLVFDTLLQSSVAYRYLVDCKSQDLLLLHITVMSICVKKWELGLR